MLSKPSDNLPRPPRKEQPTSNTPNILLIIIIVVLVGIIGAAAGYIYYGSVNHLIPTTNNTTNITLNSTNQTNTPANNTTQTSTGNSNGNSGNNGQITENQAVSIAEQYIPAGDPIVSVEYFNTPPPRYIIIYEDKNNPTGPRGAINVDTQGNVILNNPP